MWLLKHVVHYAPEYNYNDYCCQVCNADHFIRGNIDLKIVDLDLQLICVSSVMLCSRIKTAEKVTVGFHVWVTCKSIVKYNETWLSERDKSCDYKMNGYQSLFRRDRTVGSTGHGGVAEYVSKKYSM